jgi:hypothetical protein
MDLSPSSEADRFSTSKIPLNWWYLHVHYHIHKCQPPVSVLNQIQPGANIFDPIAAAILSSVSEGSLRMGVANFGLVPHSSI